MTPNGSRQPIGVFDSGIGGLSILKALRAELPGEDFIYIADTGHAPYGERGAGHVLARSRALTRFLVGHNVKAVVVACNTATAAAVDFLRADYPGLPFIGVEPALKPAALLSRTGHIGVLATRSTLASARFQALLAAQTGQARFTLQACDGLAAAIEDSAATGNTSKTIALCARYTGVMGRSGLVDAAGISGISGTSGKSGRSGRLCEAGTPEVPGTSATPHPFPEFGNQAGQIDTLVLGCTHYPLARPHLRALLGPAVQIIDNGQAVARQTRRRLQADLADARQPAGPPRLLSTGSPHALQTAASRWLGMSITAQELGL